MPGYVYIMTNKPRGTLYIGVTSDLMRRIFEHKQKMVRGYSARYNLDKFVYVEEYPTVEEAIHREKCMKEWRHDWKVERIEAINPEWNDLYEIA